MTDGGWWDEIDDDRSGDDVKVRKLLNLLARSRGTTEEKRTFLLASLPGIEQKVAVELDKDREPRKYAAKVASLAISYWNYRVRQHPDRYAKQGGAAAKTEAVLRKIEGGQG